MAKRSSLFLDLVRQHSQGTLQQLKRFDGNSIAQDLSDPERISSAFWQRHEEIGTDGRLTGDGKVGDRRTLGRDTLTALEKWHKPLREGLDAHEKKLRDDLRAAVLPRQSNDPADRMEAALLRAEVRRIAQGMGKLQLELLYRQGDHNVRRALEELPQISAKNNAVSVRPFVTKELREEVLLESAREALPEVATRLDDIAEIRATYQTIAAALKREIQEAAPGAVEPAKPRIVA